MEKLEWRYPRYYRFLCPNLWRFNTLTRYRFVMVKPVEALSKAVLKRLGMAESTTPCMMFSSQSML